MSAKDDLYDEAIALQQSGNMKEAVAKLEQLVAEEPGFALAHAALSIFYNKLEEFDRSVEHGRKVCELEPQDSFSFVAMSLMCQKAGKIEEAEQALLQARQVEFASRDNG